MSNQNMNKNVLSIDKLERLLELHGEYRAIINDEIFETQKDYKEYQDLKHEIWTMMLESEKE